MIDFQVVHNGFERLEISYIGFLLTKNNPADAFTKIGNCEALNKLLRSGIIDHLTEKWITRSKSRNSILERPQT